MSGLEGAASVAAFVSLAFQAFEGCIEAYKLCETAAHASRDGPVLNSRFAFERMRLERWAQSMGLHPDTPEDDHPHWLAIQELLNHQCKLLNQAAGLCARYGPQGRPDAEDVRLLRSASAVSTIDETEDLSTSGVVRSIRRRMLTIRNAVTWAIVDKEKLEKLLREIGDRNYLLDNYLAVNEREYMRHQLDAIGSALVYQCRDVVELDMVQRIINRPDASLVAAAKVKSIRLTLDIDRRDDELSASPVSEELEIREYTAKRMENIDFAGQPHGLQVTSYKESLIVVEWRTIDDHWAGVDALLRKLAVLLSNADNAAFHSLPCTGFVNPPGLNRFGFVFDVTSLVQAPQLTLTPPVYCHSLDDMLPRTRFVDLAHRMRIAYNIAEAVTQLHTSGWLHKGICPGHVRFLGYGEAEPRDVVRQSAYLVGYGYARKDTGDPVSKTELPGASHSADIYRHPNARSGPARKPFQKRFDMYSLACVLVELAFWQSLTTVFGRYGFQGRSLGAEASALEISTTSLPSLFKLISNTGFRDELSYHAGSSYMEAIELCLGIGRLTMEGGEDEIDSTTLVEMEVLSRLRSTVS